MFTPFLIVSVAEAWQLGINKHLLEKWARSRVLCGARQVMAATPGCRLPGRRLRPGRHPRCLRR